jgi:hypothetical protein
VAPDLDAPHRICPPLTLKRGQLQTAPQLGPPSVPRSGRAQREQAAWEGTTFFFSRMARYGVGMGPPSIRRNDAPNTMGPCGCSMPPASRTAAPVPYASPVKAMAPPPTNHVGSALSCIPCLSQRQKRRHLRALLLRIPSCGGIGHALSHAAPGYAGNGTTWSRWKHHPVHHRPPRLHRSRVLCARIGA